MQKKLSFCFLRQNLSAFVETETYRNRKFDPETEISASGSTFGFVSAQPLTILFKIEERHQRDSTIGSISWRRGEIMQKISFANIECDLDIYILECNSGISVKRCWPNKLIAAWISKAISAFYCFLSKFYTRG